MADLGGGSSKSSPKGALTDKVRTAVGKGNVAAVRRYAENAGLSRSDRRGIVEITRQIAHPSFVDRVANDATSTLHGLAPGIANLAKGAADEATGLPQLGYKAATGQKIESSDIVKAIPGVGQAYGLYEGGVQHKADPNLPVSSAFGASLRRTADRATDPQKLIKDYSAHPLNTLLEDAGNVALVTGGAAKVANAAGLERTANVLNTGSRTLGEVANGPFLPVSPLAKGANALVNKGLGAASESRLAPVVDFLHATPAQRTVKNQAIGPGQEAAGEMVNAQAKTSKLITKLLPKEHEQAAAYLIATGRDRALATLRTQLGPERFATYVHDNAALLDNADLRAAHAAADHADGLATPLEPRLAKALPLIEERAGARQAGALARGELNPEQTGHAPLSDVVAGKTKQTEAAIKPLQEQADRLRAHAAAAREQADRVAQEAQASVSRQREMKTIGEFGPNLERTQGQSTLNAGDIYAERALGRTQASGARASAEAETRAKFYETRARVAERRLANAQAKATSTRTNAEASVEAMPARFRPAAEVNRAAVSEMTAQSNHLRGQGLHAEADLLDQAAGEIPTSLEALHAAGVDPTHIIRTVERETRGSSLFPQPQTRKKPGSMRQRTGKGKGVLTERAQASVETTRARDVIHNQTYDKINELVGKKVSEVIPGRDLTAPSLEDLRAAGYEPLNPRAAIDQDTVVVPSGVARMTTTYFNNPRLDQIMTKVYDPSTRAFKTMVLPLSPSWQVGNLIGNTLMAMFAGGVDPVTLGSTMVKSLLAYKRTGELPGPNRLQQHGATYEAQDFLQRGGVRSRNPVARVLTAPVRAGYAMNSTVDNLLRSAVYLAKKQKGYSDEMAMRLSLRAMGDFTKLSPFERRVVRRIIPFYAWQKHLAKLALTMPVEHPLRTAWTLSLANTFGNDGEAWQGLLPGYMQGTIPVGGGNVLSTQNLFPFASPLPDFGNPGANLKNLSPQLKFAIENLTGESTLTGRPFTRPPGTGKQDEMGNIKPTAPSVKEQLLGMSPQVRAYRNLSGYNNVARYQDGSPVRFRGDNGKLHTIPSEVNDSNSLLKFIGLSVKSEKSLKQIADSIIKKKIANFKLGHPTSNTKKSSSSKLPGI